ncbi:MAG: GTP 3',8-cyclase MoaA [Acidobacteria bacterium]|nr:GTP 3',8-cyclase MoaA [Acidobacteriota bacterium]
MEPLKDSLGRRIKDLRFSVTDRCNFFCSYCRDEKSVVPRERREILRFEEIVRLTRILIGMGIEKVRLTGGEPLLRREIEALIGQLSHLDGLRDLAITTNGFLLGERAAGLRAAGLRRINLSMDSTRRDRFDRFAGVESYDRVMNGLRAAVDAGFERIKINTVLIRGENDDEVVDFLELGRQWGVEIRFIEFMPLEEGDRWKRELVVAASEIVERVAARYPVTPLPMEDPSQTACEYLVTDLGTTFGIIASVSNPFCGHCSRIRITADGCLRTCLFSVAETDLKRILRTGSSDSHIAAFLREKVSLKEPGHRINEPDFVKPRRRMLAIGG